MSMLVVHTRGTTLSKSETDACFTHGTLNNTACDMNYGNAQLMHATHHTVTKPASHDALRSGIIAKQFRVGRNFGKH